MITSLTNQKVKDLCKLQKRKNRQKEYLLYDLKMIDKAIEKDLVIEIIKTSDSLINYSKELLVSKEVMFKITGKEDIDTVALCKIVDDTFDDYKRVILLDDLQDPNNIGMIIKACQLFNYDTIFLNTNCADIYNPKCLNEAGVSFYDIHLIRQDFDILIDKLKKDDFKLYVTGLRDNTYNLYETKASDKIAIMMGNEGSGVKDRYFDLADYIIKIPMENIDSLNVAIASSIVMEYYTNILK